MVLRTPHLRWALLGLVIAPASIAGLVRAGDSSAPTHGGIEPDSALAPEETPEPVLSNGRLDLAAGVPPRAAMPVALPAPRIATAPAAVAPPPAVVTPAVPTVPTSLTFPVSTQRVWPALVHAAEVLDAALAPMKVGLMTLDPTPLAAANFVARTAAATRHASLAEVPPLAPWESERTGPATRVLAELAPPGSMPAPAALRIADDSTWRSLDSRLFRMRTMAFDGGFEVGISGFIKFTAGQYVVDTQKYERSASAFSLDDARIEFAGETDDVRLFVSIEGANPPGGGFIVKNGDAGDVQVLDAFAQVDLADWVEVQVGAFRSPVLFSSGLDDNELLLINRTFSSLFWQQRDEGAMLHGQVDERLDWWLAVQNGASGAGDDVATTVRASLRLFGEGEAPRREGAFDADLGQTLYLGAAYYEDMGLDDGEVVAADAHYTFERFGLSGEFSDYGSGIMNHQQWSLAGSFMVVPEQWEVALRYEDFGDRAGELVQLGLNRYLDDFHSRVQLVIGSFDHPGAKAEATLVQVGVVVSL